MVRVGLGCHGFWHDNATRLHSDSDSIQVQVLPGPVTVTVAAGTRAAESQKLDLPPV